VLIQNGLFPCSSTNPQEAVSIAFLEFYLSLFERSCDAIHTVSCTLNTFYDWQGFMSKNSK
ncbi:hypothetical protein FA15DRAFT_547995, partial [Coprinopsis marcescibilis]